MKNLSYANRGQEFEILIRGANECYRRNRVASIEKLATEFLPIRDHRGKVVDVKVEEKSKVDFIGRYYNIPIVIEAKSTFENNIRFDAVAEHQADYMDEFTAQPGTIGMVVVSFNLRHYYAIPWVFWQAAYNARVRPGAKRTSPVPVVEAFGQKWTVPPKFSVRMDELNPAWKVPTQHNTFGLHYLINAAKYITPKK